MYIFYILLVKYFIYLWFIQSYLLYTILVYLFLFIYYSLLLCIIIIITFIIFSFYLYICSVSGLTEIPRGQSCSIQMVVSACNDGGVWPSAWLFLACWACVPVWSATFHMQFPGFPKKWAFHLFKHACRWAPDRQAGGIFRE